MNILIGIHYFPPHVGGMEIVAQTQAALLTRAGHEVTVLTSAVGAPAGVRRHDGYTVRRLPVWNFFERRMGVPFPFFSPALLWHSYRAVKQADVVHLHDVFYQTSCVLALWARLLDKPVVVTQHVDMIPHPSLLVRLVQRLVYQTSGKFIFATSRRVAILNSNVRDFLLRLGVSADKLVFMPNGVDSATFRPDPAVDRAAVRARYNLPADKPVALFVGRFVPKKGFNKLIQAASDDYVIAFAGGQAPANAAGDERLVFLGSLTPPDLAELYNAVDIFILPSEGEGFPLTVQEAMASQLPVVISANPGYDMYQLDPAQLLQITPDIATIRRTLTDLAHNPTKRRAMAAYAYDYAAERFHWSKNIEALETAYQEVQ